MSHGSRPGILWLRAALLAGALLATLATAVVVAPAFAADRLAASLPIMGRQIHGTVKAGSASTSAKTFVVTTARHGDVSVHFAGLPAGTQAHGKARAHQASAVADLHDGDLVVLQGRLSAEGGKAVFEARRIHVLPARATTHTVGTVDSATVSSLTLKLADGSTRTFALSADTRIEPQGKTVTDLKSGTRVTVVSKDDTAKAVVIQS
ncbi:MAG: hypothetical protein HY690_08075 [Chloroflexi bacterium]|nr:hypothetical protein [Chloroflexota bacterium]